MKRPLRILAGVAIFAFFITATGRAIDHQLAIGEPPIVALEQPGYRYQGRTAEWWSRRAVQARKDANARGRTIRRLQNAQRHASAHFFDWMAAASCVIDREGTWTTNTGNGYYGALQADIGFQRTYAPDHLRRWGTADNWPWWAQLEMGYRGWLFRGWNPWPNTARACGLR
jgi:hypothetical protein